MATAIAVEHRGAHARAILQQAEAATGALLADLVDRTLPVSSTFAPLLPHGVRKGSVVEVPASTSLAFALLAAASAGGAWVAMVGLPDAGLVAAAEIGIDLDRVALVPDPGPDLPAALATLIDGVDTVLLGARAAAVLEQSDRRRIEARLRERGGVLVSLGEWSGATLRIVATQARWAGVGRGHGRLRSSAVSVRSAGRGAFGRARSVTLEVQADCALGERSAVPALARVYALESA